MAGLHTDVSLVTSANRYYGLIEVYKSVIKFGPQENYGLDIQYPHMVRDMNLGIIISY